MNCLFCGIVAGEIPSAKIYEDDKAIAILDISPTAPGHALVIPKEHTRNLSEAPIEILASLLPVVQKVANGVTQALGADGFNLIVNNGEAAGQIIHHLHLHIIPRKDGDGLMHLPGKSYAEGEIEKLAEAIKKTI